ncbi:MAG: TolC family protein [Candidatus Zixiibacteriota bacterium]
MSAIDKSIPRLVRRLLAPIFFGGLALTCLGYEKSLAVELTLDKAVELAINKTARGDIIDGKYEVARQNFDAKRINFYVPEISINGSIPGYAVDESFRFFGGSSQKQLYKTRELNFSSFVELNQSLMTGGDLTITANLTSNRDRYPDTRRFDFSGDSVGAGTFVEENRRQGFFNFSLSQPLFRPSQAKHDLNSRRDEMDIARLNRITEQAALEKEVTEAYISLLQAQVKTDIYHDKLEHDLVKASIDSAKYQDGILSEEDLLESTSLLLDAELQKFEFETQRRDQQREMALLLDIDATEEFILNEPAVMTSYTEQEKQAKLANWENSIDITKARREFEKAERSASFSAAGHGIQGDLNASYSLGRGDIETEYTDNIIADDIKTTGWTVGLNVRVPVWDGGAGGAEVKAAWFAADQSKLEFQRAEKKARADIVNLLNQLDVSNRRLEIMQKQIGLADNRLKIAGQRYQNGEISKLTYLESRIFYLETKDKYLEELKLFLVTKVDLESKFAG